MKWIVPILLLVCCSSVGAYITKQTWKQLVFTIMQEEIPAVKEALRIDVCVVRKENAPAGRAIVAYFDGDATWNETIVHLKAHAIHIWTMQIKPLVDYASQRYNALEEEAAKQFILNSFEMAKKRFSARKSYPYDRLNNERETDKAKGEEGDIRAMKSIYSSYESLPAAAKDDLRKHFAEVYKSVEKWGVTAEQALDSNYH